MPPQRVIRVLAVPDYLDLSGLDEVFRTVLDRGLKRMRNIK